MEDEQKVYTLLPRLIHLIPHLIPNSEILPPTMMISRDTQANDFFLVQNADGCDAVKNDIPEEPPANDKIAEEDPSYYFQDAIILVSHYFLLIGFNQ
jgi:hypothetical protein